MAVKRSEISVWQKYLDVFWTVTIEPSFWKKNSQDHHLRTGSGIYSIFAMIFLKYQMFREKLTYLELDYKISKLLLANLDPKFVSES